MHHERTPLRHRVEESHVEVVLVLGLVPDDRVGGVVEIEQTPDPRGVLAARERVGHDQPRDRSVDEDDLHVGLDHQGTQQVPGAGDVQRPRGGVLPPAAVEARVTKVDVTAALVALVGRQPPAPLSARLAEVNPGDTGLRGHFEGAGQVLQGLGRGPRGLGIHHPPERGVDDLHAVLERALVGRAERERAEREGVGERKAAQLGVGQVRQGRWLVRGPSAWRVGQVGRGGRSGRLGTREVPGRARTGGAR